MTDELFTLREVGSLLSIRYNKFFPRGYVSRIFIENGYLELVYPNYKATVKGEQCGYVHGSKITKNGIEWLYSYVDEHISVQDGTITVTLNIQDAIGISEYLMMKEEVSPEVENISKILFMAIVDQWYSKKTGKSELYQMLKDMLVQKRVMEE